MNENTNSRNTTLNLLKAFGCIAVVFIHVKFPGRFGNLVENLSNFAVPCFLMITGYFSFGASIETLTRRTKKICKITFWSLTAYFLFNLLVYGLDGKINKYLGQFLEIKTWLRMIIINDFNYINGGHLWYLPSLIYAYLICMLFVRYDKMKLAYGLMWALLCIRLFIDFFSVELYLNWHYLCNALIGSLPWMLLGHFIASKKESLDKFKSAYLVAINFIGVIIIGTIWKFAPTLMCKGVVGTYLCAITLFLLAVKHPHIYFGKSIDYLGARLSMYVYICQHLINGAFGKIVKGKLNITSLNVKWIWPIFVLILDIILSLILDFIFSKKRRKIKT